MLAHLDSGNETHAVTAAGVYALQIRCDPGVMYVHIYPSRHPSLDPFLHPPNPRALQQLIHLFFFPPHPFCAPPTPHHTPPPSLLVGAYGSGPPLICSQNKQPGKHHETFRGGRAAFSLIHTGNPEMHKKRLLPELRPCREAPASVCVHRLSIHLYISGVREGLVHEIVCACVSGIYICAHVRKKSSLIFTRIRD